MHWRNDTVIPIFTERLAVLGVPRAGDSKEQSIDSESVVGVCFGSSCVKTPRPIRRARSYANSGKAWRLNRPRIHVEARFLGCFLTSQSAVEVFTQPGSIADTGERPLSDSGSGRN